MRQAPNTTALRDHRDHRALTAAIFLINPLLGTTEVNGELISVSFLLSAIAAGLTATSGRTTRCFRWLALAGALATAAVFVKQN